eukprot:NODE_2171_length_505_cov_261.015707_g2156_i0.p1 GENE.NODE_2171_length_505_cov_261.015707_g2156_i0~~NODE_2171_length_505_cov_261.015707_g2156_i0.p1  ORF type:complete len:110 (-),score=1.15 NODE_2171_length_505_cov_261.015707_g2156_i0:5-334(-)
MLCCALPRRTRGALASECRVRRLEVAKGHKKERDPDCAGKQRMVWCGVKGVSALSAPCQATACLPSWVPVSVPGPSGLASWPLVWLLPELPNSFYNRIACRTGPPCTLR